MTVKSEKVSEGKSKNNKKIKDKKPEKKTIGKKYLFLISLIIILSIIGISWIALTPETAKAQLIINSGIVQIKHSNGEWEIGQNGMDLYQSDSILTGNNSSASIIIFKGSIIRLANNTKITLKKILEEDEKIVNIQQDAGRTWSSIQKISGIDHYEVQTPTTVASVRGTSFDVDVDEEGITIVSVIKGIVNVSRIENDSVYSLELGQNWSIIVSHEEIGQKLNGHGLIQEFEPDEWIEENLLEDETFKEDIKDVIYQKIEPYIDDLKNLYGMTDEEIDVLIEGFINGDFSIPENTPEEYKQLFELT